MSFSDIIKKHPDNSLNLKFSKFLTELANEKILRFTPSEGQSQTLDMLPKDLRDIYLSPFFRSK